ncbi:MAG: PEP-CTERM sorting domain-containing protein [Proteobacteria bacterium]|nr:PEP-CTERM sorting domain-containing protein [Pseudomonadota bacterium]
MKKLLIASVAALAVSAGSAQADMIAGWDFSQYLGAGALSTDGATLSTSLDANYSDFDPTFGAGAESAAFGTMYLDGQFGSSAVSNQVAPTNGSLASNLTAPGGQPFDSLTVLTDEGQTFANLLALTVNQPFNIVFEADLTSAALLGTDWGISFGGRTFSGSASVGIEFSTDGVSYSSFGSVDLSTSDTPFSVALGSDVSSNGYVRLLFDGAGGQPIIDNVAITATTSPIPEPGTAALLLIGLAGLARSSRRRA